MAESLEDIKKLPPEARLRKLKELEEKRKAEEKIAKALADDSKQELVDQQEWERKVPIPQLASEDGHALTSSEERELHKAHKSLSDVEEAMDDKSAAKKSDSSDDALDELVAFEKLPEGMPASIHDVAYGRIDELSREPIGELYGRLRDLQSETQAQGYMSEQQQRELHYVSSAVEEKLEDVQTGEYVPPSERAKTLLNQVKGMISSLYQRSEKLEKGTTEATSSQNYQSGR